MSIHTPLSSDVVYVNAFNLIPGIGAQKLFALAAYFDSFGAAWQTPQSELVAAGLSDNLAASVVAYRKNIDPHNAWQRMTRTRTTLLLHTDPQFPPMLRAIASPPFCLYVRGAIPILCTPSVAIVGSRKISEYGARATIHFAQDLACAGITVVSGLALGTDITAHRATLDSSGKTIAILAGGIDDASISPRSHINVATHIITSGGAIISEYPLGTTPSRGTFPARNRIMAGLTDATIIIEAAEKSGTLITAAYASQFHKNLFALPGSIFSPNAYGPNHLISTGAARSLLSSDDIIRIFHKNDIKSTQKSLPIFATKEEEVLYHLIKDCPDGMSINELIKESQLAATIISSTLTMLEIGGTVKNIGNQTYISP